MIPGITAGYPAAAVATEFFVLPLTYDEEDAQGAAGWARSGGAGPHVTPLGFEADGYEARLKSTSLPSWVAGASSAIALQASLRINPERLKTVSGDTVIHVGADASGSSPMPKLALKVLQDPQRSTSNYVALQGFTTALQTAPLFRPEWKYQRRFPALTNGANRVRPQALMFLDVSTILVTGHFEETESRAYRVDLVTGAVTGAFTFGTTTNRHIASLAKNSAGDVWCVDYDTGNTLKLDLASSFSSGSAVITATWNTSVLSKVSGIDFITVSGTEYVLIAEYATTASPYLYVIPASLMVGGSTLVVTDRYKRFSMGQRTQGITVLGSNLWASKNRDVSTNTAYGWIERYNDIASIITSTADGAIISPSYSMAAPSQYVEDIKFHPTTSELWTMTEGWASSGDLDGFLGIWSSAADGTPAENHVGAWYNGAGTVSITLNGAAFGDYAWSLNQTVAVVSVGGPPQATAGMQTGFCSGYIRNVRLQNSAISQAAYADTIAGTVYEPNSLSIYTLTLTNPDAESAVTGWTNEVGSIATRSANPTAYQGTSYFSGGSNAQTISRQRLDVLAQTGLTGAQVDAGGVWAKLRWRQASYTGQDPCSMGMRMLNASQVQQSLNYSGITWVPYGDSGVTPNWYPRCIPVSLPSGARYLDAVYRSDRDSGTNNDGYVDAISLVVYRQ